jgi:hypothetical protein
MFTSFSACFFHLFTVLTLEDTCVYFLNTAELFHCCMLLSSLALSSVLEIILFLRAAWTTCLTVLYDTP